MKNFNTFRVYWKIRFLGRGFTKNQYRGADCLKREGFGQFAGLRVGEGGLGKKEGVMFLRG